MLIEGQLRLGEPIPPPMVRREDPDTSKDAAVRVRKSAGRLRHLVLVAHQLAPNGLTDDELAERYPEENPPSLGKRRSELAAEGHVRDSGRRRMTRRGSSAIVWVLER